MPSTASAGDAVGLRLGGDVGLGLRTLERSAHGVEVVLAEEQHRQLPELGQVQRLVELALGDGAIAEEAGRDARLAAHLVRRAPGRAAIGRPPPTIA